MVEFRDATVKIWYADLCSQQPQRPCWNDVGADLPSQQCVDGKSPFSRKETHQKTDQGDQIEVIHITRLVQQEEVCERKKKYRRGDAVKKTHHHTGSGQTKHDEVDVHPMSRPWLHPTESVVSKIDNRFNEVTTDPTVSEVTIRFPQHNSAEEDAEKHEE